MHVSGDANSTTKSAISQGKIKVRCVVVNPENLQPPAKV